MACKQNGVDIERNKAEPIWKPFKTVLYVQNIHINCLCVGISPPSDLHQQENEILLVYICVGFKETGCCHVFFRKALQLGFNYKIWVLCE